MMIARIRCDKKEGYVEAKQDEVWQYIRSNYKKWRSEENIALLYLTKRFVPGETSLIVNANDADVFLNFLNQHIFPLECVIGAHIFNLTRYKFFPIPTGSCLDLKRFTVTINAVPKHYKEIYNEICKIEPTKHFVVNYIAYSFHEHGSDIIVSILAKGSHDAKEGVRKHIEPLEGIVNTDIMWISKTKKLCPDSQEKKLKGLQYMPDEPLGMEMF
jgi:hypothetical protein